MAKYRVTSPDGQAFEIQAPDSASPAEVRAYAQANFAKVATEQPAENSTLANIGSGIANVAAGAVKGASDIGATLLAPVDAAARALGVQNDFVGRTDRRQAVGDVLRSAGADPESLAFKGGELGAQIAGTAGVGGTLAKGVMATSRALPAVSQYAPKLAAALESGGFSLGGAPAAATTAAKAADWATRIGSGAAIGASSAGLVNPSDAPAGAVIGGAFPVAVKAAGAAGSALSGKVSQEVSDLYQKAKSLGIDIPADRIANSRPLNAIASSLNYVPLSGRAATEEKMLSQMNRAVSRTFGQDSDNVTAALRKASADLGAKFEQTLSTNTVKVDNQFVNELVSHLQTADNELGNEGARIIGKQIDEIMAKTGANGEIDGQAAYNIKKALDRIGNRNAPEAFYARDLKKSLMGALNRSLGPADAAEFSTVRKQYGNMLDMEKIAQNGAEGGVSVGRLANLKNINNPELQDIADIAAQFIRTRESPHGSMQRVVLGSLGVGAAGATGTLPLLAAGVAAGRVTNNALNSRIAKSLLLDQSANANRLNAIVNNPALRAAVYRGASAGNP